ncbi:unnamed protein product [Sphagnum tenellum]
MGFIACGIAHDFNNILQMVFCAAELIQGKTSDGQILRHVERIIEACDRGRAITNRVLLHARKSECVAPVELKAVLASVADVIQTDNPEISVRSTIGDDGIAALVDRYQLETVLINICNNARDAMPDGGVINLLAEDDDEYVCIRVSDTGQGMDEETLSRVTEAFFTTKPAGKGTGLGLSMAKVFAEQFGGGLSIISALGLGTTISIYLPKGEASADINDADSPDHATT